MSVPQVPAEGWACMVTATGIGIGFLTLSEAIEWVAKRKPRNWEIMLRSGCYELSLEEWKMAASVPKLKISGMGVRPPHRTVIQLFGFKPKDHEDIAVASLKIETTDLLVHLNSG